MPRTPIIPCHLLDSTKSTIDQYVNALQQAAASIGDHGLSEEEFWESGIFRGAIERLRGTQAATTEQKREFAEIILNFIKQQGVVKNWQYSGVGERHDYELEMVDGRTCIIETKGCLDGNNTNIFKRPANADEFIIWSLCQNSGADPAHNAWSGIHTRLSAEIIHSKQLVDGVVIWDMVCGTKGRPCPKLQIDSNRSTDVGYRTVPPPCLYLFPRTIPDPRNNPTPPCHRLDGLSFFKALYMQFKCDPSDVIEVRIEARMTGVEVERRTLYYRSSEKFSESKWTKLKRSR